MRSVAAIAAIVGLCCEIMIAQVRTPPAFDAASIRRSARDSDTFMKVHPGGRLELSWVTLKALIALAYRLQPFQVSGGSAWVRSEYFDINTEAAKNPSENQLFLMIQTLLAQRFSLKVHFETAERPVYLLVAGTTRRTRPPGLQVSTEGSCVEVDPGAPPDPNACGGVGMGVNHLEAHEVSMARFAEALGRAVDRKVIDRTGRTENFNISLQWLPDEHQALPSTDAITLSPDTPSIFTALQEQLGLKLEPSKAAVDLLVIDRAQKPDEN
jgi:uncharacterized protein (TIGR03435 family)